MELMELQVQKKENNFSRAIESQKILEHTKTKQPMSMACTFVFSVFISYIKLESN